MQLSTGYILSTAVQTAVRLGIADRLAAGPQTTADLARAAGVLEDPLYRVLRLLASAGLFQESAAKTFALNPAAELLRSTPGSMRDMALFISDPMHFRVYADAMHTMTTGVPAMVKTFGMQPFEYFEKNPAASEEFNNAMTSFSATVGRAAIAAYDFAGIGVLVDVAGGHGELLMSILRAHPAMRGILFDLDHVIAGARPRVAAAGLQDRCEAQSGDFFKSLPAGGDAYLMKHIIHDWDDERALVILRNTAAALKGRPGGRLILIEAVLQPANVPDYGKVLDIEMLLLPGGRERTEEEFAALLARAGFELTRIVPTESPLSVLEARLR